MTEERYKKISDGIRRCKYGEQIVIWGNKIVTAAVYAIYIAGVVFLMFTDWEKALKVIMITGASFVLLSVFREVFDSPRPYTVYNFEPIIKKEKKGKSFPSRHVFSAFVIAVTFMYINVWVGIAGIVLGCLIAFGRVIAGVHFPKDVIAGALLGVIFGMAGQAIYSFIF